MKLDFNFPIKRHDGAIVQDKASATMIVLLEQNVNTDERYIDKIDSWIKSLYKSGQIECDVVDAKELKNLIMSSRTTFIVAKVPLKNYIQKKIDEK